MTSLVTALRLLASTVGVEWSPPDHGLEEVDPRVLALHFGLRLRRVRLYRRAWWHRENGPLLAFRRTNGAPLALLPAKSAAYRAYDPATGTTTDLDDASVAKLAEEAFMPYPRTLSLARRTWLRMALVGGSKDSRWQFACSLTLACLSVAPALALFAVDGALREDRRDALGLIFASLSLVAISAALFEHTRAISALRWRGRANLRLHAALWDRLLDLQRATFRRMQPWQFCAQLRDALAGAQAGMDARLALQRSTSELVIALGVLLMLAPQAVAAAVATLAVTYPVQLFQGRNAEAAVEVAEGLRPQASRGTYLLARFLPQLRTLGCGEWLLASVKIELNQIILAYRRAAATRAKAALASTVAALLVCAVTATATIVAGRPPPSIGLLGCVLFLSFLASRAVTTLASTLAKAQVDRQRVDKGGSAMESLARTRDCLPSIARIESVELDGVSFRYPGASRACICEVSLSIARGDVIALTGPSGSGKSTLVRLLLGLERPEKGTIRVNGLDLNNQDTMAYRCRVGAVFQDQQIGYATVRSAILGMTPLALDQAWEAARLAQLDDVIAHLPMGMQTIVSEGPFPGSLLRQLMIARSLARSPDLLALDEAMASLDEPIQERLIANLRRLDTTVIFCAHRPSTLALADRVVQLTDGHINATEIRAQ
jgi:ABC-type bacteriocin/lantibiotic exporter with double-glycine peptidase domain